MTEPSEKHILTDWARRRLDGGLPIGRPRLVAGRLRQRCGRHRLNRRRVRAYRAGLKT